MTKNIRLWYLYDFANSFASVVLVFYYPLILSERGASDIWIGVSASIATAILLLILPYFGAWSDKTGKRIHIIKIASILMVASLFILSFLFTYFDSLSLSLLYIISFFYILFQVCFQGSYVFYSAMLRSITDTNNNTKVSGIGLGLGQFGNAVALGIIGPIVGSSFVIIGLTGKPLAIFIGGVLFALISLPFFRQKESVIVSDNVGFSYKGFLRKIFTHKKIFYFIIGYALLADTILTFQLYVTLYIKKVFDFSDQLVTYAGMAGLISCVLGGFVASKFSRLVKDKEKALKISALLYAFCFAFCALIPNASILVFISLIVSGISYGLVFSLARTVYSEMIPIDQQGEFFSIYTVFERAASVIGPLVWLLTFYLLTNFGEGIQYRGSVLLLAPICLLGVYFLRKSRYYN